MVAPPGRPSDSSCGSMPEDVEREKRLAAEAAAELVQSGMTVGLGTGSTAAYLIRAAG